MRDRILIADDHPLVRDALTAAVRSNWPDVPVDEATTVAEAEAALRQHKRYTLCLLDLMLPDAKGFSGFLLLQKLAPETRIVIVSAREDPQTVSTAYLFEASGYLTKSAPMSRIAEALRQVRDGRRVFPDAPRVAPPSPAPDMRRRLDSLSAGQFRVLIALADGRLNKQIAADMHLTEATVKAHLTAIFRKLGVANRTQAILAARPLIGAEG